MPTDTGIALVERDEEGVDKAFRPVSPIRVDQRSFPSVSEKHRAKTTAPSFPMVTTRPPAMTWLAYPSPSPLTVRTRLGPDSGHRFKRPVSPDFPSRAGPLHCGQSAAWIPDVSRNSVTRPVRNWSFIAAPPKGQMPPRPDSIRVTIVSSQPA